MTWDQFYVLGWVGRNGRSYLSSWTGDAPVVRAVVTGTESPPLWNAPVPLSAQLHAVPEGKSPEALAAELGGIVVMGWVQKVHRLRGFFRENTGEEQ